MLSYIEEKPENAAAAAPSKDIIENPPANKKARRITIQMSDNPVPMDLLHSHDPKLVCKYLYCFVMET